MAALHICKFCNAISINSLSRLFINNCFVQKSTLFATNAVLQKPKRPLNGYMKFMLASQEELKAELKEGRNLIQSTKAIAEKYRSLNPEKKKEMNDIYQTELKDYQVKMEQWKNSLTEEELAAFNNKEDQKQKKLKIKDAEKSEIKKMRTSHGIPRKPPTPFFLFMKEKKYTANEGGLEWRNLSEEEKKPYFDTYKTTRAAYEEDLLNWEKRMIAEGLGQLVRKTTLKKT